MFSMKIRSLGQRLAVGIRENWKMVPVVDQLLCLGETDAALMRGCRNRTRLGEATIDRDLEMMSRGPGGCNMRGIGIYPTRVHAELDSKFMS